MSFRLKILYRFYDRVMPRTRGSRMAFFEAVMKVAPGTRVLDLGGTTYNWQFVSTPLDITILNLPGTDVDTSVHGPHRFTFVEGDATAMPQYADGAFDIVFSNSVIEHVGGIDKQQCFAREAQRLAKAYYIQTPSKYFPLEAHTGLPFWWYYPPFVKRRLIRRWESSLPAWCEMVKGTGVLSSATMEALFPGAILHVERIAGLPKSYTLYNAVDAGESEPAPSPH